jgi:hypothetical protein
MDYSLSGADLMTFVDNQAKIVTYPQLDDFKSIDDLLSPYDVVFILYETKPKYGHWTVLFRVNNTINFFDSYNYQPDAQFTFISKDFRVKNEMTVPTLTKMLLDAQAGGYEIHYNNHKIQAESKNIATCGRHVLFRLLFKDMDIDTYYNMLKFIKKETKLTFDEIVTIMTGDF